MSAAYRNGRVVRDPDAVLQSGKDTCLDENGDRTPCCVWETDDWASAYVGMTSLFWLWTVMLAFEVRMFTVAGVTAQWYFAPPGTRTFAGTTIGSIKNALGPSFGSLALGSLVLTAVRVAREINENARRNARENGGGVVQILACLVTSCMDCVYALIQHVTKYATIQCAVTGAAFCDAAVAVSRMLTENFLNAYAVWWWLPGTLLSAAAFVFSAAYGTCVGLAGYVAWNGADGHENAGGESVILRFRLVLSRARGGQFLRHRVARRRGLRVRVLRDGPGQAEELEAGGARDLRGGQGEDGQGGAGGGRFRRFQRFRRFWRCRRSGTGRQRRVR